MVSERRKDVALLVQLPLGAAECLEQVRQTHTEPVRHRRVATVACHMPDAAAVDAVWRRRPRLLLAEAQHLLPGCAELNQRQSHCTNVPFAAIFIALLLSISI